MKVTFTNEELGVALDIDEDGRTTLCNTRPCQGEAMISKDEVFVWAKQTYDDYLAKLKTNETNQTERQVK